MLSELREIEAWNIIWSILGLNAASNSLALQFFMAQKPVEYTISNDHTDVGDGCRRPNVLVTIHVTNIESEAPTSHSGVLWCWWPM